VGGRGGNPEEEEDVTLLIFSAVREGANPFAPAETHADVFVGGERERFCCFTGEPPLPLPVNVEGEVSNMPDLAANSVFSSAPDSRDARVPGADPP